VHVIGKKSSNLALRLTCHLVAAVLGLPSMLHAQVAPTVVDPNLRVRTVADGLNQPTSMAFLGPTAHTFCSPLAMKGAPARAIQELPYTQTCRRRSATCI